MANQFSGSLESKIKLLFKISAEEYLLNCLDQGLNSNTIAARLGVQSATINKYCRKYGITLSQEVPKQAKQPDKSRISSPKIDNYNILYKPWRTTNLAIQGEYHG